MRESSVREFLRTNSDMLTEIEATVREGQPPPTWEDVGKSYRGPQPPPGPESDGHKGKEPPKGGAPQSATPSPWPDPPSRAAFHGLAGELVSAIEPHSEADPVALLAQALVAFGNVVGREPHFAAEADRHGTNLFTVLVGETAKGRKGSAWGQVRREFRELDPTWDGKQVLSGLSSGEGLIWAVRDPIERQDPIKEKNRVVGYETVIVDHGIDDKRLLVLEPEFASVLRIMGRQGNTLSPLIRQAWDSGNLRVLTKNNPARATGAHISAIAHITRGELLRHLDSTEYGNGFANRFLWFCVRRSKYLPEGGNLDPQQLESVTERLRRAANSARSTGELKRDEEARADWHKVYPALSNGRPGLVGAVISRAEAQVMRLASVYALLDCSAIIRREHLHAALALWEYCEASALFIFGDSLGDPTADETIRALRAAGLGGMTRTEIRDFFGRNKSEREIGRALQVLQGLGMAFFTRNETKGRPEERWFATSVAAAKTTT